MSIWNKISQNLPLADPSPIALRHFEPENPALLVPRTLGLGWTLNLGAVAVKLGLIRPDDSLPDLEEYISLEWRRALRLAPFIGLMTNAGLSALLASHSCVASQWSLSGRPRRYTSGKTLALVTLGVAGAPLLLTKLSEDDAADVVLTAQTLGLQAMVGLASLATLRETKRRGKRQPLLPLAALSAPTISATVLISLVKGALRNVERNLQETRSE